MSREFHLKQGDVERGFLESDLVREDTFFTQSAIHAYLEPHAALAEWDMSGRLTLHTSTQTPYYVQQHLALTLGINPDRVRVIKPMWEEVSEGSQTAWQRLISVQRCSPGKRADRSRSCTQEMKSLRRPGENTR